MKQPMLKENLPYSSKRAKVYTYIALLILMFLLGLIAFKKVNEFFNAYVISPQSPILIDFRSPLNIQPQQNSSTEEDLQRRIQELEASISALKATPSPTPNYYYVAPSPRTDSSIKTKVLNAISRAFGPSEVYAAEILITKESNFNPLAVNKSSGACGLFQALPCSKLKCDLSDVDCQINWGITYLKNRYKVPSMALAFHQAKGWY